MKLTLYEILGIPEDATSSDIENAYQAIERQKAHLLRSTGNDAAADRIKFAHQAISVLGNPASRARYDAQLRQRRLDSQSTDLGASMPQPEQTATRSEGVSNLHAHPEDVIAWEPMPTASAAKNDEPTLQTETTPRMPFSLSPLAIAGGVGLLVLLLVMIVNAIQSTGSGVRPTATDSGRTFFGTNAATPAIAALRRLDGATQVGLTYMQYSQELIDANDAVSVYLNSADATRNPTLAKNLRQAIEHYIVARDIWQLRLDFGYSRVTSGNMYYGKLLRIYPASEQFIRSDSFGKSIDVDAAMQHAWSRASAYTSAASASAAK